MAKKKKETGPGPAMIIVLVFFILSTTVLGVMFYLGLEETDAATKKVKEEADKAAAASKRADEMTARNALIRIYMGTEDAEDRDTMAGAIKAYGAQMLDEQKRITDRLAGAFPTANAIRLVQADGSGGASPAVGPVKNIPTITKDWAKIAKDFEKKANDNAAALANAEAQRKAAEQKALDAKTTFDAAIADLTKKNADNLTKLTADFNNLKTTADAASTTFRASAEEFAKARAEIEEKNQQLAANAKDLSQKLVKARNPDPSDFEARFKNLDMAKLEERKGEISAKDDTGTIVTLSFRTRYPLAVGQTFMVLAPDKSLVTVIDREKALDKDYRDRRGLFDREPFSGNEQLKGTVEIIQVVDANTARARIVNQAQEVRNPISKRDAVYNITLSNAGREHVAFCGIIDLDGDGLPNNEEFIRILEKNNVIVDAYLDLKTGEIKGRGIQSSTKFLILGPDAPEVGRVKEMLAQAKDKGVQVIDARKFLMLIGVKLPNNPFPPRYSTTNIAGDPAAPKKDDADAAPKKDDVPAPPAAPKKDDAPVPPAVPKKGL